MRSVPGAVAKDDTRRLLALVLRRLGIAGQPDEALRLAVELGIVPSRALNPATRLEAHRNRTKRVSNWISGTNAPRFEDALDLLAAAGLLQPEAVAAWRGISLPEAAEAVAAARDRATAHDRRLSPGEPARAGRKPA